MPPSKSLLRWLPAAIASTAIFTLPLSYGQDSEEEDIFELSPFSVDATENVGYQATSTLAGTRLRSDLRDVGSAISVITSEFLEDTGATSAQELLTYTTSTEVGGALGNFTGGQTGGGSRANLDSVRANPDSNNRVRGLASATATRDFFVSDYGFDGYNMDRVTISRGPNSILYGVGSPGGVIDSSLKKAMLGKDANKFSFRYGQRGTRRATLDVNKVLVEDRVAFRLAVMDEKINFRQEPAFEEDTRFYGTLTAKIFKNDNVDWLGATTLRATGEHAELNGTPVNPLPMSNNMLTWFGPPTTPEIDAITGKPYAGRDDYAAPGYVFDNAHPGNLEGTPGSSHRRAPEFYRMWGLMWSNPNGGPNVGFEEGQWAGVQGLQGTNHGMILPDGTQSRGGWALEATRNSFGGSVAPGFTPYSVPQSTIDFENLLLTGHTQNIEQEFDAYNVTLEQSFLNNKAGIEIAFDSQEKFSTSTFPFGRGRNSDIAIDVGLYTTNGELNPNVGRPIMTALNLGAHGDNWSTRESKRATAFYDLDFTSNDGWSRHFGRHVVTGLYNESERDTRSESKRFGWGTDPNDPNMDFARDINGNIGAWNANFVGLVYVGDDQRGATSMDDIRIYNDYIRLDVPEVGDEYDIWYFDRTMQENGQRKGVQRGTINVTEFLSGGNIGQELIDSQALTLQSKFLGGNLVTTYGWREDKVTTYDRLNNAKNPDGSYMYSNLDVLNPEPTLDLSGQTTTFQAVLHMPREWTQNIPLKPVFSAHYAESENFQPGGVRRNVYNEVLGFPSGKTDEIGFSIELAEGKANLRFNWYETSIVSRKENSLPVSTAAQGWAANGWQNRWTQAENDPNFVFEDIGWDIEADYSDGNGGTIPYDQRDQSLYNPAAHGNYTNFEQMYAALGALLPTVTRDALSIERTGSGEAGDLTFTRGDSIQGLSAIANNTAKGFEFEAVFNPTKSWRIMFNAAKQETVQSDTGPAAIPFINDVTQAIRDAGLWDMYDTPKTEKTTFGDRWNATVLTPLAAAIAKEGTVSQEQRKWRWNAVTNYSFREGALKGFSVGASARWQDEVATGYQMMLNEQGLLIPILDKPFMGPSQLNGDIWFGYKKKLNDKIDWKIQLNFNNAFGDDDLIPVVTNPDGTIAVYRASIEKRWFLTNTFEF